MKRGEKKKSLEITMKKGNIYRNLHKCYKSFAKHRLLNKEVV